MRSSVSQPITLHHRLVAKTWDHSQNRNISVCLHPCVHVVPATSLKHAQSSVWLVWNSKLACSANSTVLATWNGTEDTLPAVRIAGVTSSATSTSCQVIIFGMLELCRSNILQKSNCKTVPPLIWRTSCQISFPSNRISDPYGRCTSL